MIKVKQLTWLNLRDKVAFNPFFLRSFASSGIKLALKAPGNDWKRDLSIPNVRIWNQGKQLHYRKINLFKRNRYFLWQFEFKWPVIKMIYAVRRYGVVWSKQPTTPHLVGKLLVFLIREIDIEFKRHSSMDLSLQQIKMYSFKSL